MRKPSPRCLPNTVSLYRFAPAQDPDAGVSAGPYGAALAAGVPASVQPAAPGRALDAPTRRLAETTVYDVVLAADYSLRADDLVVWVDGQGVTRRLVVLGSADQAGRGSVCVVRAEERV